jgi:hypothetical protein
MFSLFADYSHLFRGSDTSALASGARFVSCLSCRGGEGRSVTVTNRSLDIEFELRASVYDQRSSEPPMDDQTPPKSRRDTPAGMSRQLTVDDLRRAADSWRDLRDPVLMAKAWDEPVTSDVQPATNSPRRFGQLRSLSVPDTFDEPLPDAEIGTWEGNSPS